MGGVRLSGPHQILQSRAATPSSGASYYAKTEPLADLGDHFTIGMLADEHPNFDARRERSQQSFMPEGVQKLPLRRIGWMFLAVETRDANPKCANPAPNEKRCDSGDATNQEWTAEFHGRNLGNNSHSMQLQLASDPSVRKKMTVYGPGS
jgi:hypothetical protein